MKKVNIPTMIKNMIRPYALTALIFPLTLSTYLFKAVLHDEAIAKSAVLKKVNL